MFDNIALFGCKSTTRFLFDNLRLPFPIRHLITIDPDLGKRHEVADYMDLKASFESRNVRVYQARSYSLKHADDQAYIRQLDIDIAFVIGWQRLIPAEILHSFRIGAFGMHGSSMNLPLGRGRSPMNWSIIEGRHVFYTNLFRYDAGVDSGDVVDTFKFGIGPRDTGETLHFKNTLAMKYLIERNIERLSHNQFSVFPQDRAVQPTYYPKREPADSLIDWSQDVHALERFVRAVTRPFNGAFSFIGEEKVTLWDAQVFDLQDFGYEALRAGTVAAVFENGKFLVKCYGGLLLVHQYEAGCPIEAGQCFHNNGWAHRNFPRNAAGNFDLSGQE